MSSIKYIDNPAKYLIDTGLLFEINRQILHPLGLALAIAPDDDVSRLGSFDIWDYREDAEGVVYGDHTLAKGEAKLEQFMQEFGNAKHKERFETLGYVVQGGIY